MKRGALSFSFVWVFIVLTFFVTSSSNAGTFTVFGPETFERLMPKPGTETRSFSVLNPNTDYFIVVSNGGLQNDYKKVSAAIITINDTTVVSYEEFNQTVTSFENQVALSNTNQISVQLFSLPGAAVDIEVYGIDNDPPTIVATTNPEPNANGWNNTDVTVNFTCDDAISGVASCPGPVTLTDEEANQVVSGTAVDNAGNSVSVSVTVNLDKTPPDILRSWTPADDFATDLTTVEIEGQLTDDLSGVGSGTIQDFSGTIGLQIPDFTILRDLQTDIQPGEVSRHTQFTISASDLADNVTQQTFVVRYTQSAYMLPTDPNRTEVSPGGVVTSVDSAIVGFDPSVDRNIIEEIIGEYDGGVAGFLPNVNIVMAIFPTDYVADLRVIVQSLLSRSEVDAALPVIFTKDLQVVNFDNDSLGPYQQAAYNSINSSAAANYIINNNLPLNPVSIAVIDSGLDGAYGRNNEFTGIQFFNLCTADGRQGQPGIASWDPTGHGTWVTSVLAGDNNGEGNNGLVRGIPGGQFNVSVFGSNCGAGGDFSLDLLALSGIVSGAVGEFDVVNISWVTWYDDAEYRKSLARLYSTFFNVGYDILWVAAAGNNGPGVQYPEGWPQFCGSYTHHLPAALACNHSNVVSVAGYNPRDNTRITPSDYGEPVTISAPGEAHLAFAPNSYIVLGSGTSLAAPFVAGAAALLLAVDPMEPVYVKTLLADTAQDLADPDLWQGGLDVLALIQATLPPPNPEPLSRYFYQSEPSTSDENGGPHIPFVVDGADNPQQRGLTGFYLNFRGSGVEHNITTIGATNILTDSWLPFFWEPLYDFITIPYGLLGYVNYGNDDSDERYEWWTRYQELPPDTVYHHMQGCTVLDLLQPLEPPPDEGWVPVLVGFVVDWFYDSEFAKIAVGITPGNNMRIFFQDWLWDMAGCYRVDYAYVPPERVALREDEVTGGFNNKIERRLGYPLVNPVLKYIELNTQDCWADDPCDFWDEIELDQFGVLLDPDPSNGRVRVWCNDDDNEERIEYHIEWADLN